MAVIFLSGLLLGSTSGLGIRKRVSQIEAHRNVGDHGEAGERGRWPFWPLAPERRGHAYPHP